MTNLLFGLWRLRRGFSYWNLALLLGSFAFQQARKRSSRRRAAA